MKNFKKKHGPAISAGTWFDLRHSRTQQGKFGCHWNPVVFFCCLMITAKVSQVAMAMQHLYAA